MGGIVVSIRVGNLEYIEVKNVLIILIILQKYTFDRQEEIIGLWLSIGIWMMSEKINMITEPYALHREA
jgi:hypothetical protein